MDARLVANISNLTLSETLDGGSFSFPKQPAGKDIVLLLQIAQRIGGVNHFAPQRVLHGLKASVGRLDARPEDGTYQLMIGAAPEAPEKITANIPFNATVAQMQEALEGVTSLPAEAKPVKVVTELDAKGGLQAYRFRFADGLARTITCVDNALWPLCFVEVTASEFDEGWIHRLKLTQALAAETVDPILAAGRIPYVERIDEGGFDGAIEWNEIQKLSIPPEFDSGAFRVKRGFRRSAIIGIPTSAKEITDAIKGIADEDGKFVVTEQQDAVLIEFAGSMGGLSQDLLEIAVVDSPPIYPGLILNTATAAMDVLMQRPDTNGEVKLPIEIELILQDEHDSEVLRTHAFRAEIAFVRQLNVASRNVAAMINWNQPLARRDTRPYGPDQFVIGNRRARFIVGNGSATVFPLNHNHDTDEVGVIVRENLSSGRLLRPDEYEVEFDGTNAVNVTFPTAPALNSLIIVVVTAAQEASFLAHTHTLNEIIGLESRLDALDDAVGILQDLLPIGAVANDEVANDASIEFATIPSILEAFPSRTSIGSATQTPDSTTTKTTTSATGTTTEQTSTISAQAASAASLAELDLGLLPADGGLLPAVLDAKVESLTTPLPAAGTTYKGRVFLLGGGTDVILPGGGGRKSMTLRPGQHAACDGKYWYRVSRFSDSEPNWYAYDFERELFLLAITDKDLSLKRQLDIKLGFEVAVMTRRGLTQAEYQRTMYKNTRCQWQLLFEWGLFATEAAAAGTAFTVDVPGNLITVPLDNCPSGTPVKLTTTGVLPAPFAAGTLYYLRDNVGYNRRLATTPTGGSPITMTDAGSGAHTLIPQTASMNLKTVEWNATPLLAHTFQFTRTPVSRSYGIRIKRALVSAVDTITAEQIVMGNSSVAGSAPTSANFALRARLARFDIEDDVIDPRALVVLNGLAREVIQGDLDVGKVILKTA